jgi:hypothetical protein
VWESDLNTYNALADDAGIAAIQNVAGYVCNTAVNPVAVVKNFGSNNLLSVDINYRVDGGAVQTFTWTGIVAPLAVATVPIPAIVTVKGLHTLNIYTSNPNGVSDANTFNDDQTISYETETTVIPSPVTEEFESALFPPVNWRIVNGTGMLVKETSAGGFGNSPSSLRAEYFNSQAGTIEFLQSDPIDLSTLPTPIQLTFDVAYALYTAGFRDTLRVYVSTDCGLTWTQVYNAGGPTLSTAPSTLQPFVPQPSEWRKEIITLSSYAGSPNFIIRFYFRSQFGNNLYLDNINLGNTNIGFTQFAENDFSTYPNPVEDEINIEMNQEMQGELTVQIHDLTGRLCHESNYSGKRKIKVPAEFLAKGSYALTLISREKLWRKLFVKSF